MRIWTHQAAFTRHCVKTDEVFWCRMDRDRKGADLVSCDGAFMVRGDSFFSHRVDGIPINLKFESLDGWGHVHKVLLDLENSRLSPVGPSSKKFAGRLGVNFSHPIISIGFSVHGQGEFNFRLLGQRPGNGYKSLGRLILENTGFAGIYSETPFHRLIIGNQGQWWIHPLFLSGNIKIEGDQKC